jgi:hypothetical protein
VKSSKPVHVSTEPVGGRGLTRHATSNEGVAAVIYMFEYEEKGVAKVAIIRRETPEEWCKRQGLKLIRIIEQIPEHDA